MRWRFLLGSLALALATQAPAQDGTWADGAPREIAAPHYGDALFQHYQDHTFSALTALMVSQHFGRLGSHAPEAELLRGGLLLSYGLHEEAATVFAALIDRQAAPAVRDRAWYFLALSQHQRGLLEQADISLAHVGPALPAALQIERQLLQAHLLMARQDYPAAALVLEGVKGSSSAARYARYNLAVALLQTGGATRRTQGLALLDTLGQEAANDDEQRALRDRANLARGYAALQDSQPREARAALQRVRLNGALSNKALLGYGWAAMGLNDPRLALVPWQELAARPEGDAAVLEARLAVPYAQGEIGAFAHALRGYEQAAAGYAQEQRAVQQSIVDAREGRLIATLMRERAADGLARFTSIRPVPSGPQAAHLLPLLASHAFHEGLKNLHDLAFLGRNAQQWLASLSSFEDMLDNRRKAYAERLPEVLARRGSRAIAELQRQRDVLAAEVRQAELDGDGKAYASDAQRAAMARVARSRAALAPIDDLPADTVNERLRLVEGALTWQLAQGLPARSWEAKKGLRDSDATLIEARAREAALSRALQTEPTRQAAFAQRIADLRTRLQAVAPQVLALSNEQQQGLQAMAVAALQQQQERLAVYAAQAQLAIAQIQDSAQFARQDGAVPAKEAVR